MIGDIIVALLLALLLCKPVLWIARKVVLRSEEAFDDIQKPIKKEGKNEKSKRTSKT